MHNFGLAYIATAREQLYTRVIHCNKPNNTAAFLTYPHKLSTVLCTFLHTCAQVTIVDNSLSWITRHCAHLITVDIFITVDTFIQRMPTHRMTISTSPLSVHTLMPGTACSAIPGINRFFAAVSSHISAGSRNSSTRKDWPYCTTESTQRPAPPWPSRKPAYAISGFYLATPAHHPPAAM